MLSNEINKLFSTIRKQRTKKSKLEILEGYHTDSEFKDVLQMIFSPLITFSVGKKTFEEISNKHAAAEAGRSKFTGDTYDLLDALARRDITGSAAKKAIEEEYFD